MKNYPPKISLLLLITLLADAFVINTKNCLAEFTSSNLPIVKINTHGKSLSQNYRIPAKMEIIWNDNNQRNYVSDPANHYNGRIEIELHGKSSLYEFPKKSFRIETQNSRGENLNVSLLGMPKENDWIFYAPYSDKTLLRNALSYTLAGEINAYAPRVKFCELILNNSYEGVYVLTEKIKRDDSRVNIAKMTPNDIAEPEISGGYIFRKDKTDPGDNIIRLFSGLSLIVNEPKKNDIVPQQETWLINYLNNFETVLYTGGNYQDYLDVLSFVDNFLIVEFTKNIDGYRLSTYFYKDRNGKIVAGPVWDYNLSLGNADYNDGWMPAGWYYPYADRYWFGELINDPAFWDLCSARWKTLRKYQLNLTHILALVDDWLVLLEEAVKRNFERWPILGIYVWPNPGFPESGSEQWLPPGAFDPPKTGGPTTYAEEIEFMKNFIEDRLQWLDEQFGVNYVDLTVDIDEKGMGQIIFNSQVISDAVFLGAFPQNELITLIAEPLPGYKFVQWEKLALENETSTLIPAGAVWKYLDDGSDQGTAWYSQSFNDSYWKEGPAELGYGDGDETTVVSFGPDANNKYTTTYFRTTFNVTNPDTFTNLTVHLIRDDGAVVYLNGKELVRSNMPDDIIRFDTFASDYVADAAETMFHRFQVNSTGLAPGKNVVAVEIHQSNLTSSDISFDLKLMATKKSTNDVTIIGTNEKLHYLPLADAQITAVFKKSTKPPPTIVINEINYHPLQGDDDEYIELCSIGDSPIDLTDFSFANGIEFIFPTGTIINPGEFILLLKNIEKYPKLDCQRFQWTNGNLADEGELILLFDHKGITADSVYYRSQSPWPSRPNGGGFSLELKRPFLDNSLSENWQGSYHYGGSPGKPNIRVINELYINEFLASNHLTNRDEFFENNDWIELYNGGTAPIDISGLYLSDDIDKPEMWQIPTVSSHITTIQPDSFLLLWADGDTAQGPLHLNFQLNMDGESIMLAQIVDEDTIFIDSLTYTKQTSDISYGRFPDGSSNWLSFSIPTPGFSNVDTAVEKHNNVSTGFDNLEQNYPNPFNLETTIRFTVKKPGRVVLRLYDIQGRDVRKLVDDYYDRGQFQVKFDARNFSSGLYFYTIQIGNYQATKKMVYLK